MVLRNGTAEAVIHHLAAHNMFGHVLHLRILLGLEQPPQPIADKDGLYGVGVVLQVVVGGDGV